MTLELRYAVRSDVGLLREGNEDSAYAGPRLLAVADGMGGHAAGEVASALTISSMAQLDSVQPGDDMLDELSSAVIAANAKLQEKILANPAVEGMGTTLTALLWSDGHAAVCHIGDSRGYLLRDGELYQITHDHTLVQSLVDEGRISADDVSTHPQRSLLLRALDGRSAAEPDLSVHDSLAGDRYLLCSDGLSGVVSDETLRDTLATIEDPDAATRQLIELAIHGGGPDNITCIVADVVDTATTRLPLTTVPVLAGAAANMADPGLADGTGPLHGLDEHYEDHGRTAPQPVVDDLDPMMTSAVMPVTMSENGAGPGTRRRSHRAQSQAIHGLVPPPLADRDHRARGASSRSSSAAATCLAGEPGPVLRRHEQQRPGRHLPWHQPAHRRLQLVQPVPADRDPAGPGPVELPADGEDQLQHGQPGPGPPDGGEHPDRRRQLPERVRGSGELEEAEVTYNAEVAQAKKLKKPTGSIRGPGQQPAPAPAMCPPSAVFGIPASALPSAALGSA